MIHAQPVTIYNELLDKLRDIQSSENEFASAKLRREFKVGLEKMRQVDAATAYLLESNLAAIDKDADLVVAHFHRAERLRALSCDEYHNYVVSLLMVGRFDEAGKAAAKAVELAPTAIDHRATAINVAMTAGHFREAYTLAQDSLRLKSEELSRRYEALSEVVNFLDSESLPDEEVAKVLSLAEKLSREKGYPVDIIRAYVSEDEADAWVAVEFVLEKVEVPTLVDLNFDLADALFENSIAPAAINKVVVRYT